MTISRLRSMVDALCRKYATERRIYRLRPLALAFCDEMASALLATGSEGWRTPGRPLIGIVGSLPV